MLRTLHPAPHVRAFYDGREPPGTSAAGWVRTDLELGVASYAVVDGRSALVYDTHTTPEHGARIRRELEAEGVRELTVLLSHWHLDHVAGTEAFADCEIVATARTAEHLAARRAEIEAGTLWGPPAIRPLVLPTTTFEDRMSFRIGSIEAEAVGLNVHTDDAAALWLPESGALLAGDTVEDTVTYVDHPEDLELHLAGLDRLWELAPERVLPAHGEPDRIAAGGYPREIVAATQRYIRALRVDSGKGAAAPLRELIASDLASGTLTYHPPYEEVHRHNLARVLGEGF